MQLLYESIRSINNTIKVSNWQRDTCIGQLESVLDEDTFRECQAFTNRFGESRLKCVMEIQVAMFNRFLLITRGAFNKDISSSGKDDGYMYDNSSGCSNYTPPSIIISTSTTPLTNTNSNNTINQFTIYIATHTSL